MVWKTFYVGVNASGSNDGQFFIGDIGTNTAGASTRRLLIDTNGNVGIGSIANTQTTFSNILTLPNTASTAGRGLANAWSTYSSVRWKTNIQPIQNALAIISRLRGVSFNWKNNGEHEIAESPKKSAKSYLNRHLREELPRCAGLGLQPTSPNPDRKREGTTETSPGPTAPIAD